MEYLDIYDNNGNVTGKVIQRGDKSLKLSDNEHIAVSVIYIENSDGKFLIQKTSQEKGGMYSSTGGHVCSGETPLESIKREVLEELGIDISKDKIEELGFILYDMPIRYMFYIRKDIDLSKINIQNEEVDYVEYMSANQIKELINKKLITESHGKIFEKVLKYKKEVYKNLQN
ncbi:MAG: NUDIX domain-containing protein [Bacilli bacterium]|nr:NUDIX domain-containing protein [Bacilli bacterium]